MTLSLQSKILLAGQPTREKMADAVDRSKAPSKEVGDPKGGFHEEGGYYGKDKDGNNNVVNSKPGKGYVPGDRGAVIDVLNPADGTVGHEHDQIEGTFHVHIKGNDELNPTQNPSDADINNAGTEAKLAIKGNHYVIGAGNGKVYIYIY